MAGSVTVAVTAIAAGPAAATVRVENHNDPAGDPTVISYQLINPDWSASPFAFSLRDNDFKTFGQPPGAYTARALLPPGWKTTAIRCVGPGRPGDFEIDVPNGQVTMNHQQDDEQSCAFTNRRLSAPGAPSSGLSPSPAPNELPKVRLPRRVALLSVVPGKGRVTASIRLMRSSHVRLRLFRRDRVIATKLVHRKAGKRVITIAMPKELRKRLRARGRTEVVLTLKIKVIPRHGPKKAFRYTAIVPL
jgi:hypothetical protein